MVRLTDREAFDAMREFLARHYSRTGSDEIGGLLGDLSPMDDGHPADASLYEEWEECVKIATQPSSHRDAAE